MSKLTHKHSNTRLYHVWERMKDRCYNKNSSAFQRYGGRGIKVCDEWKDDFQTFMDWSVSHGYDVNLTIDRINNDGNYEPSNCRWATMLEQQNNKRSNKILTINGEGHTISQWSRIVGINPQTICERLKRGWDVEKAITTKVGGRFQ